MARQSAAHWTDEELAASVEAYVYLLRLQVAELPDRRDAVRDRLLESHLSARNDASLRYRLRNISAVVVELGGPALAGYSPASQVGRNVRERLRSMLLAHPGFLHLRDTPRGGSDASGLPVGDPKAEALARLAALRVHLDDVERELIGVGHNGPPEALNSGAPARGDFERARQDIEALEGEVRKLQPDPVQVAERSSRLLDFGLRIALWVGERATKFTDTALKVLAPVAVAKATGLMPILVDALKSVGRLFH